jgi:DNA invertase Pin-like site-specific DNA recombinase
LHRLNLAGIVPGATAVPKRVFRKPLKIQPSENESFRAFSRRKAATEGKSRRGGDRSAAGAKRVAFYQRVSTNGQTTANQRRELQAVAKRHGWNVVHVFEDNGISGAKDRDQRPGLDALLKAVARREIDMVAAWSVDRLGRSLKNLVEVLGELHAKGVDLYLHRQGLDTSTPSGRAMFQMMGVFAEFERAMIRERVLSGLARAKAEGITLGRPAIEDSNAGKYEAIKAALAAKKGIRRIARELQTGVGTVLRIKAELAA